MGTKHEPAHSIIKTLGGGNAARGAEVARVITGLGYVQVYRWAHDKGRGGQEGLIPVKHVPAILSHSNRHGLGLRLEDIRPDLVVIDDADDGGPPCDATAFCEEPAAA